MRVSTTRRRARPASAIALACAVLVACGSATPPRDEATVSHLRLDGGPLPAATQVPGTTTWAPWPSAQHDARHSGASTGDGPTAGAVRWSRDLGSGITPGPVVGPDGTIYAAANDGVLHAIDPATGSDRWTHDSGHRGGGDLSTSPLVLPDGTVLWGTPGDELVALSPAGTPLWTQALPGVPTSPASTDGHRVYVGDRSGGVSAIDVGPGTHHLVWTVDVGGSSYGSVVVDGAGRIYTTSGSSLVAVDDRGTTGSVAWHADPGDGITEVSAGLAADGTALLGTNGTREWAYARDGSPRWNAPRVITYSSPVVTADGLAYVADHSGRVRVLDVTTGAETAGYQLEPPQQIWTAVAVDRAHRLYFGTLNGHVLGVDSRGATLFDVDLGDSVYSYPALTADGALVVGSRNGRLVAID